MRPSCNGALRNRSKPGDVERGDRSGDVFVHRTDLPAGIAALYEGQAVTFDIERMSRGPRAVNIAVAAGGVGLGLFRLARSPPFSRDLEKLSPDRRSEEGGNQAKLTRFPAHSARPSRPYTSNL